MKNFWQKSSLQWSLQLRFLEKSPTKNARYFIRQFYAILNFLKWSSFFLSPDIETPDLRGFANGTAQKKVWRLWGVKRLQSNWCNWPPLTVWYVDSNSWLYPQRWKIAVITREFLPGDAVPKMVFRLEFYRGLGRCVCVCVFVCFFHWRCDLSFLSSCLGFVFRVFLLRTYGKSLSNHHLREYVLELFSNIEESHGHLTLADWDVCWVASLVPVKRCNPLKFQIQPGGQTGTATWLLQRSGAMGCGGSTGDGTDGKPKIWWFNFFEVVEYIPAKKYCKW